MFHTFFIKIYILFFFLFIFSIALKNYFSFDFLYLFVVIYGILLITGKKNFSNYFNKLFLNFSFKNIFGNITGYIFVFLIIFGYFLFGNNHLFFLVIISYILLLSFEINTKNCFYMGLLYFFGFFILYIWTSNIFLYSSTFAFGIYFFIFGILYHFFESFFSFLKEGIGKISLFLFFIIFIFSLYFKEIITYLPYILIGVLGILNISKFHFKYEKNFKIDLIIFGLFFIIFIPLINDFFVGPEKNLLLFSTSILFIIYYILSHIILKRALKN